MDDVPGGERAVAEVELNAFTQEEGPLFEVKAGLPLLGQAGGVLAGLGIHFEQRFEERVVLEVVRTRDHPESVAVLEPGGGEHQFLALHLLRRT